jgi:hypothetical protein
VLEQAKQGDPKVVAIAAELTDLYLQQAEPDEGQLPS